MNTYEEYARKRQEIVELCKIPRTTREILDRVDCSTTTIKRLVREGHIHNIGHAYKAQYKTIPRASELLEVRKNASNPPAREIIQAASVWEYARRIQWNVQKAAAATNADKAAPAQPAKRASCQKKEASQPHLLTCCGPLRLPGA